MKQLTLLDKMFLLSETREVPMHVGSVSLFILPEGADATVFLHSLAKTLGDAQEFLPPFGDRLKIGRLGLTGPPSGSPIPPWTWTTISATRLCPSRGATGNCSPWFRTCTPPWGTRDIPAANIT